MRAQGSALRIGDGGHGGRPAPAPGPREGTLGSEVIAPNFADDGVAGLALLTLRGGSLDCTHAAMVVGEVGRNNF